MFDIYYINAVKDIVIINLSIVLKLSNHITGILLMIINAFCMSLLYIIVKILIRYFAFTSNQVGFLYKLTIFIFTILSCYRLRLFYHLKTQKFFFHFLRGSFSIIGSLSMFYAVSVMNVLNAAAISELTPAFMVLAGIFVFNEKVNINKIILLVLNIFSIALIEDFNILINKSHYFAFLSLFFWSVNNIIIKKLTQTEYLRAQLFYSSFFAIIFSFPLSFFCFGFDPGYIKIKISALNWPNISSQSFLLIIFAGISSLFHKISFFKAYQLSDMSVVGFFDYLRLPFTCLFSCFILYENIPGINVLFGYFCIILSSVYFIIFKVSSKD